jgi:hypothetical protein
LQIKKEIEMRRVLLLARRNAGKDAGMAGWKPALRGLMLGCLALLLLAPAAMAQEQKKSDEKSDGALYLYQKPPEPQVQRLFVLKYADPNQMRDLLNFMGTVRTNTELHAVTVSATANSMAAIEDAIKRLDVPTAAPQNIDLTMYLVAGDDGDAASAPLPRDLDSVVAQLGNNFSYKAYRLWDVLTMRTRTGQVVTLDSSGGSGDAPPNRIRVATSITIRSTTIAGDGTIRINGLQANSKVQGVAETTQVGIRTDVDIKEGQKVVVGKQSTGPNQALFLVIMAKVVQ